MRLSSALASLALVLALAACGGSGAGDTSSAAIPSGVANRLANMSDSVAASWEAGDQCGAAQQADQLRHAADDAIASGQIPAAYQDDLEAAITNLQNTANCPAAPPPPKEHDDKGKKGHDKHDDTGVTITTGTTGTTTEEDG
jgi:hypothetical protein